MSDHKIENGHSDLSVSAGGIAPGDRKVDINHNWRQANKSTSNKSLKKEHVDHQTQTLVNGFVRSTALEYLTLDALKQFLIFRNKGDELCALLVQSGVREDVPLYSVTGNFIYRRFAEMHGIDLTDDELAIQLKRIERHVKYVDEGIRTDRYEIENWSTNSSFTERSDKLSTSSSIEDIFNDKIRLFRVAVDADGATYLINSDEDGDDIFWPIDSNEVSRVILSTVLSVKKECIGNEIEEFSLLLKQHAASFGAVIDRDDMVIGGDA